MVDDDTLALVDRETRNFFPEARLFEHRHESGLGTLYGPAQAGYEPAHPLGDIRRPLLSPLQDSVVVSPLPPDLRRHAVEASRPALGAGQGHVRDGPGNAADAAFAKPDIYEYLEERRVFYAIRLPSNKVLQWEITPLLIRPVGRPPKRPVIRYDDFWYRAGSWDRARRVVAKVEWHRGELFPRVGFIVTNMTAGAEGVVRFHNGRGTAEQWIKEGNFLRRLCLPKAVKHWSLRSVQVKLIKMGARVVLHARWLIFQLSEVSVPRRLFEGVLDRIGRLSPAPS